MAHYAFLDENNIVTEVIPGKNEGEEGIDWEAALRRISRPALQTHLKKHPRRCPL
jgi:hypothetical protein